MYFTRLILTMMQTEDENKDMAHFGQSENLIYKSIF